MSDAPIFRPLHQEEGFLQRVRDLHLELARSLRPATPPEESRGAFDGTYPHPGGEKVAGHKNPPPPGGSQ